jgi:hypothetical protein
MIVDSAALAWAVNQIVTLLLAEEPIRNGY